MPLNHRAIGTFSTFKTAELALQELKNRGFLMNQVSVVGRDIERQNETTGANTSTRLADAEGAHKSEHHDGDTAKKGSIAGGTIGGVTGLLVGLGAIAIPGVGPIMLAGAAATAAATALSGGVIGAAAGSLVGGLVDLGLPEHEATAYSDRVAHGDYLVMVEGTEAEITLAQSILSKHGISDWRVYDSPRQSTTSDPAMINHPRV